jgi:hypothetical protein
VFVGGNTLIPSMLRAQLEANGAGEVTTRRFDLAIQTTREFLEKQTARISISGVVRDEGRLEAAIRVDNLAGHKLPTAYPSRRVWICFRVLDVDGRVLFASGRFDQRGRLVDAAHELLPSEKVGGPTLPHFSIINDSQHVQVYESVMADADGQPTYSLLRGAAYEKDNRLLPLGWTEDHPRGELTMPVGTAEDGDFSPGSDVVRYVVDDIPPTAGKLKLQATLYYQVLGARFAAELLENDVPEVRVFDRLYRAADPRPEILARTECESAAH